jgi:hypothetical protein
MTKPPPKRAHKIPVYCVYVYAAYHIQTSRTIYSLSQATTLLVTNLTIYCSLCPCPCIRSAGIEVISRPQVAAEGKARADANGAYTVVCEHVGEVLNPVRGGTRWGFEMASRACERASHEDPHVPERNTAQPE